MAVEIPSNTANVAQGSLLSGDFLRQSIRLLPDWSEFSSDALASLRKDLIAIYTKFPTAQTPNESQTEDDLIWPILTRLGWGASLRQQNLAPKGREDVPDWATLEDLCRAINIGDASIGQAH